METLSFRMYYAHMQEHGLVSGADLGHAARHYSKQIVV